MKYGTDFQILNVDFFEDFFVQKDRLKILISAVFKYFAIFATSLENFAKFRSG